VRPHLLAAAAVAAVAGAFEPAVETSGTDDWVISSAAGLEKASVVGLEKASAAVAGASANRECAPAVLEQLQLPVVPL